MFCYFIFYAYNLRYLLCDVGGWRSVWNFDLGVLWNDLTQALSVEINNRTTVHEFHPHVLIKTDGSSLTGINFELSHPVVLYNYMSKYTLLNTTNRDITLRCKWQHVSKTCRHLQLNVISLLVVLDGVYLLI
jgi:hypothetical protein